MAEAICRLCANVIIHHTPVMLFGNHRANMFRAQVIECGGISIEEGDGLPEYACVNCKYKLNAAFKFRSICKMNDLLFREKCIPTEDKKVMNVNDEDNLMDEETSDDGEDLVDTTDLEPICELKSDDEHATYNDLDLTDKLEIIKDTDYFITTDQNPEPAAVLTYDCSICEQAFPSQNKLNLHIIVHSGEKPYQCPICNKSFQSPQNMKTHIKALHTDPAPFEDKCILCGIVCYSKTMFTTHDCPFLPHACPVCKKRFASPACLTKHMRVHTGDRPHKCFLCEKAFQTAYNLKTHMRVHSKEMPYKCEVCNDKFRHKAVYNLHIKQCIPVNEGDAFQNTVFLFD